MARAGGSEADVWKSKYYEVVDRFDKKEAEWIKSEKLLSKALGRISIVAEGESPLIDHHLQALRVVLKEKFSYYRIESVLSELFNIISQVEKKSAGSKKDTQVALSVLVDVLNSLNLEKAAAKKRSVIIKQLQKEPDNAAALMNEIQVMIQTGQSASAPGAEKSSGLFAKLFSKKESAPGLEALADAIAGLPWPEKQLNEKISLIKSLQICDDETELDKLLRQFKKLSQQWQPETAASPQKIELQTAEEKTESFVSNEIGLDDDSIKQKCLQQFVSSLKSRVPTDEKVQSINIAATSADEIIAELTEKLVAMLNAEKTLADAAINAQQPDLRELFIQLVEQLMVPVALMDKADALKQQLESELATDWRRALKKVVHFINEVRLQEYQEEDEYENFLQQVTKRLQEMVQFIENENRQAEDSGERGSALNQAMVKEVAGLKQGMADATTLQELQSVVNQRLDAISEFVMQHRKLEQDRLTISRQNLTEMQEKIQLLETQTAQLKVSLDKKNREAMYDALTAIPNRLFFEKRVKEDIGRWKRFDTPLSIAIWDVDKFKSVNDTYGHKAGDKVLKAVAQILNKRIRETDFLARYGGEEFVMLLPGTIEEDTLRLANELRTAVQNCEFHYNEKPVEITISCGISGFREGDELNAVFERADKALYQAKHAGRNRCVVAACRSQ